jgi:hypothetical protein
MDSLHVDCASCRARGPACSDCVISVLLGPMTDEVELSGEEVGALDAMARSGLLPPLRLIRGTARDVPPRERGEEDGPGFASAARFP